MTFLNRRRAATPSPWLNLLLSTTILTRMIPRATVHVAAQSSESTFSNDYFCGTNWLDAAKTCPKHCPSGDDSDCSGALGDGYKCFTFTGCREKIDAGEIEDPDDDDNNNNNDSNNDNDDIVFPILGGGVGGGKSNFCGTSWGAAMVSCGMPCPQNTDAECTNVGETCFAAVTNCNRPLERLVADMLVTLLGPDSTMEDEDGDILGGTIYDILSEVVEEEGVALDGVDLGEQEIVGRRQLQRRYRNRGLLGWHEDGMFASGNNNMKIAKVNNVTQRTLLMGSSALDVSMTITGDYRPPPYLDLNVIAQESINREGPRVISTLRTRGSREGRGFFERVDGIEALARSAVTARPTQRPERSPTYSPTSDVTELPSWSPSAYPTEFPTSSPTRAYDQHVLTGSTEDLTLGGTTTFSYGYIFNMRTRPNSGVVLVNGLSFYTESTTDEKFELWSRADSFKDHKGDYVGWDNIASGTVKGRGMGRYTSIPEELFEPVSISGDGGTRAFYLTLQSKQLVYRIGVGSTEGGEPDSDMEIQYSNEDIEIWEGESVLSYPFPSIAQSYYYRFPRAFLGAIRYDRMPCKPLSLYGPVFDLPCPLVPTGSPTIPQPTATPVTSPPSLTPTLRPVGTPTAGPAATRTDALVSISTEAPTVPVPSAAPTTAVPTTSPIVPMRANVVSTFRNVPDRSMNKQEIEKFLEIVTKFLRGRTKTSMVIDGIDFWHHTLTMVDADEGSGVSSGVNRGLLEKRNRNYEQKTVETDEESPPSELMRKREMKRRKTKRKKKEAVVPQVVAVEITMILRISIAFLPENLLGKLVAAEINENQSELLSLLHTERAFYTYFKDMDGIMSRSIERVTEVPTLRPTTLEQYLDSQEVSVAADDVEPDDDEGVGFIIFVVLGVAALWCFLTVVSVSYLSRRRVQMKEDRNMEDLLRQEKAETCMKNNDDVDGKTGDEEAVTNCTRSNVDDAKDPSRHSDGSGVDVTSKGSNHTPSSRTLGESSAISILPSQRRVTRRSLINLPNLRPSFKKPRRPSEQGSQGEGGTMRTVRNALRRKT